MSIPQEDKKKKKESNKPKNYTWEFIIWGVIVFFIWLAYLFAHEITPDIIIDSLPDKFRDNKGAFEIGTFGDYFGALNALFAGLAFAGLIVTIRQQSADLKATKQEMRNQTVQFAEQNAQTEIKNIKEEVHARINWIKQLEKDIQITIIRKGSHQTYCGTEALFELTDILGNLIKSLFPDKEDTQNVLNLNAIEDDYLSYVNAFQYTTAWVNSICTLLDDIEAYFDDIKVGKKDKEIAELNKTEARYIRAVINSFHYHSMAYIYTHHDTLFQYPIIEKLRKQAYLNSYLLIGASLIREKRVALSELFHAFDGTNIRLVLYNAINKWREYKGWEKCEMMMAGPESIPDVGYSCSIEKLREDKTLMSQIRSSSDFSFTLGTGNSLPSPFIIKSYTKQS